MPAQSVEQQSRQQAVQLTPTHLGSAFLAIPQRPQYSRRSLPHLSHSLCFVCPTIRQKRNFSMLPYFRFSRASSLRVRSFISCRWLLTATVRIIKTTKKAISSDPRSHADAIKSDLDKAGCGGLIIPIMISTTPLTVR